MVFGRRIKYFFFENYSKYDRNVIYNGVGNTEQLAYVYTHADEQLLSAVLSRCNYYIEIIYVLP